MKKRSKLFTSILGLLLVCTVVWVLSSCPNPVTKEVLLHVKDAQVPLISILGPAEGSYCAKTVIVSGQVIDTASEEGDAGQVASLSWEVLSSTITGEADIDPDGSFTFQFASANLGPTFVVQIEAIDWNGNIGTASLTLLTDEESDIPSFSAASDNGVVNLQWDPVPFAGSYTLYYTTNGTYPSESYGIQVDDVTSPWPVTGLENGNLHRFLLKANSTEGEDNWSGYVSTIPLSPTTLAPRVRGGFQQIELEWGAIPATDTFQVWRATSENGSYQNITGSIEGNEYTDTAIQEGQVYYYQIKPDVAGCPASAANVGLTDPFPTPFPYPVGSMDTLDYAWGIEIFGDYAYVADSSTGLQVVDISTPTSPVLRGFALGISSAFDVALNPTGTYAYVADNGYGISIINIINPDSPTRQGGFAFTPPAQVIGVDFDSNYVYTAGLAGGMRIFQALTPINLFPQGTYNSSDDAVDVVAIGNTAYLAFTGLGLHSVDVSNKSIPSGNGSYPGSYQALAVSSSYAYVMDGTTFSVVDVATTSLAGSCIVDADPWGITTAGDYVYLAGDGLHIVNVADPTAPVYTGRHNTPGGGTDVAVSGGYAYVADGSLGLQVFDLTQPDTAALGAVEDTSHIARGVAVRGTSAFIADNYDGLHAFDISNPSDPTPLDSWDSPDAAAGVIISGPYAYIADQGALQVLDVSNPSAFVWKGKVDTPGAAVDVALKGDYAFIADFSSGMQIINVSDVTSPELIASYGTSGNVWGIDVRGDYAYLADSSGLIVVDISNPNLPSLAGSALSPHVNLQGYDVEVVEDYAFVAYRTAGGGIPPGLQVVDISDPETPFNLANYGETSDDAVAVSVRGNYAYVAAENAGLQIFNISIPDSPALIKTVDTPDSANDVVVFGGYAYVADGDTGLQLIDLQP